MDNLSEPQPESPLDKGIFLFVMRVILASGACRGPVGSGHQLTGAAHELLADALASSPATPAPPEGQPR